MPAAYRETSEIVIQSPHEEHASLRAFFVEEGPLDSAQLFRQTVGEANYREFLVAQFDASRQPFVRTTPSHTALVQLDLPLLFTGLRRSEDRAGVQRMYILVPKWSQTFQIAPRSTDKSPQVKAYFSASG